MRRRFQVLSLVLCAFAALATAAALMGYAIGNTALVAVRPGFQAMSPLTAIAIAVLSAGIACVVRGWAGGAKVLTWLSGLLGCAGLLSRAVTGTDVLSRLTVELLAGPESPSAGLMSTATALCLVLLAVASASRRLRPPRADAFAAVAALIAGTAMLGYAYGAGELYRLPMFDNMALNTAVSLFALAIATMAAVPESGVAEVLSAPAWAGHSFTRRMLGFACLVPTAGYALVTATKAESLGSGAAMALLVVGTVAPLAWLILRDGRLRMALEAERAERSRLREALGEELEARLAGKVVELERETAEREKAEQAMHRSQRMEAVGRLTGGIAHDFNNLLQALSGNVTLLQRRLPDEDPLRRFADNAAKAVQKGAKLTGQLMSFSRTQRLTIKAVLVCDAMQEACELARASLGPNLVIQSEVPPDSVWVSADAQQLELALVNLLINARDAMPAGGRAQVFTRPTAAPAGAGASLRFLGVCVTDEGEGMPPEVARRVGEPFFTTKPQGKGTGLGLAQVFGFATQCGGEVRIETREGAGTMVEIALPLCAADPGLISPAAAPRAAGETAVAGATEVMVIDDDVSVRTVVVQGLLDAGFVVKQAADGPGGLALMADARPAVAVIDFMMPLMNGAEVARRAQARWPGLPVVFISGYAETLMLDGIADATVLRKPFDLDALRDAVARALSSGKAF